MDSTRTTRIPTTRTPTTRIRATPTPTQKTRASALARTLDPVSGGSSSPSTGSRSRSSSRGGSRVASTTFSRSRMSSGFSPRAASASPASGLRRPARSSTSPTTRATFLAAAALLGDGGCRARPGRVRGRRDDRPPGPAPELAAARGVLPLARGRARPPRAGERLLHAASGAGPPVHYDTHDVFSLQVAGEKRWLVYEPAWELPLKHQRYKAETMGEPGEPVLDVTLQAGDTLYLPRGWLHEAKTSETDSLHLTVGVNVYTWMDAFRAALDSCASESASGARRTARRSETSSSLASQREPRAGRAQAPAEARAPRRPVLDGQLTQLRALGSLDPDTRWSGGRCALRLRGRDALLRGQGLSVSGRGGGDARLQRLGPTSRSRRPTSQAPGRRGRLVLVRRLVRKGFLVISAAARGADAERVTEPHVRSLPGPHLGPGLDGIFVPAARR